MVALKAIFCAVLTFLGANVCKDEPPTEASVAYNCSGLSVTDGGAADCYNNDFGKECFVTCRDEETKTVTCSPISGWDPLPDCAKSLDEDDAIPSPRDNGCPNDALCFRSCRNRGYKSGKCKGNICNCR